MADFLVKPVDTLGLLDYYQKSQLSRLQQTYLARKEGREEEDYQVKRDARAARAGIFGVPTTSLATSAGLDQYRLSDAVTADGKVYSGSKSSDQPLPGATQPVVSPDAVAPSGTPKINPDAFRKLLVLDPDSAFQISNGIAQMDKATRETAKAKNEVGGSAAMHLESFKLANGQPDMARRQAEWASMLPDLQAAGFTPEELKSVDLSDEGLQRRVALAMDVKSIFGQQNADRTYQLNKENVVADNARADAQFGETRRHNRITERQAGTRLDNEDAITPSKVLGPILDKVAKGQPLTPAEQRAYDMGRPVSFTDSVLPGTHFGSPGAVTPTGTAPAPAPRPAAPAAQPRYNEGDILRNAQGKRVQLHGGKWVPIN